MSLFSIFTKSFNFRKRFCITYYARNLSRCIKVNNKYDNKIMAVTIRNKRERDSNLVNKKYINQNFVLWLEA